MLFFFCAANPGIETGGLLGESKFKILQKINPVYLPKTIYYGESHGLNKTLNDLSRIGISFPFIVKPDVGQGGWFVKLIKDSNDLQLFLKQIQMPFMIQEYIDAQLEFGVLYYRYPGCEKGFITSLACKELLYVVGDGQSTIKTLIDANARAKAAYDKIEKLDFVSFDRIPQQGEKVLLSFIGNHSYGTKFINMSEHITHELTYYFDCLSRGIPGFYFGRYDIKCNSIEDLTSGNFKILELNGVGSEPLHIFDPGEKILNAYRDAFKHWKVIYEISAINRKNIKHNLKLRDAWQTYKNFTRLQKIHDTKFIYGN